MKQTFKYGTLRMEGAKVGDSVRFVESPTPGQPGAILLPRGPNEITGVLRKVEGNLGYVELLPRLSQPQAAVEGGSAGGIKVDLPIRVGGLLRIS